ncbi:MAG: OmpA family protein [Spirochaetaceae bacterium]|jgi:outer membrane protein OmpA-like peptidoglycan-associated protein|nr:OmpA family protein [Spirochaetaceae bacterium]
MMKKLRLRLLVALVLAGLCVPALRAEQFRFKYHQGDRFRVLTTVQEDVYVKPRGGVERLDHHAEIVNRISVEITGMAGESGVHRAVFMTTENSTSAATKRLFSYGEEYTSVFERDPRGRYTIGDDYFMPVVRNVPVFPEGSVEAGESWSAEGEEAHDLRRQFNIPGPFKAPFTAHYRYTGTAAAEDGRVLHVITVNYETEFMSPSPRQRGGAELPLVTRVVSSQTVYFDNERGAIDHYSEKFEITLETTAGTVYRFQGVSRGETDEYDEPAAVREEAVRERINGMDLENVDVLADPRGLTLRIEDIQFLPDSAVLRDSEKEKLQKIAAQVLKSFPNNDLLVTGHTARTGLPRNEQTLSEERARAVADYLIELGACDEYHVFTQGLGGTEPIAPNTTETGRARNRRVEITIMDR